MDLLWTLLGFALACYATFLLIKEAGGQMKQNATEAIRSSTILNTAGDVKPKVSHPKPKDKKKDTPEQARLKELQKEYQTAKVTRDQVASTLEELSVQHDEEIERLKRVVAKCLEKQGVVDADKLHLKEKMVKLEKRKTLLDSRVTKGRAEVEREDGHLKRLQETYAEALQAADDAREDSESVQKLKRDTTKKLKKDERDVSNLTYKSEGMQRRIGGIERENDFLRREIAFKLNRVEERRLRQESYRNGKKGGKGGKAGGKGRSKGGDRPFYGSVEEEEPARPQHDPWQSEPAQEVDHSDDDVPLDGHVPNQQDIASYEPDSLGQSRHWADDDVIFGTDDAPRPPPTPPPPEDAPKHINDLLEKAMAHPIDRWIDSWQ